MDPSYLDGTEFIFGPSGDSGEHHGDSVVSTYPTNARQVLAGIHSTGVGPGPRVLTQISFFFGL